MTPTIITQASTEAGPPMSRLDREEQTVATAHEHGGPEAAQDGDHSATF